MGHLSGGKTVSCTGTAAISHTAGDAGKAQMDIVRVNGSDKVSCHPVVSSRPAQTSSNSW
jgi:hypothetical protein